MSSWGTAHASATNKPKFLPEDEPSKYTRADCFATESGWVMRAGTSATGNSNESADHEVLVAIGGLAGATDTTGLRAPTATAMRFVVGTAATTDLTAGSSAQTIQVEITWDEGVTVAGIQLSQLLTETKAHVQVEAHTLWSILQLVQLQTENGLYWQVRQSQKMMF